MDIDIAKINPILQRSIIGLVVEFIVAIDEARVRFTDDAFFFCLYFFLPYQDRRTDTDTIMLSLLILVLQGEPRLTQVGKI